MDSALHRHQDAMRRLIRSNVDSPRVRWGALPKIMLRALKGLSIEHRLSVRSGDHLLPLDGRWYVTHIALLRPARTLPSRVCLFAGRWYVTHFGVLRTANHMRSA